jgi:hypothetical protein
MTATAAPFGFRPVWHPTGLDRGILRFIDPVYATPLYKGMPVALNTNGTIVAATVAADILGIFAGCEYIDSLGKPNFQNFWPGNPGIYTGRQPRAYVWEDALTVFEVQGNGPIPLAAIGDQADVVNPAAGTLPLGMSTAALNSTLVGAAAQGQFRIVGFNMGEDNTPGDLYTIVQVQIARQQFIANKVAV